MAISGVNGGATPLSPNYIVNGALDFWQRGPGPFSIIGGLYAADRWQGAAGGTANGTITQQSLVSSSLPGKYFLRYSQTAFGGGQTISFLIHRIEDVMRLSGKTVTLSFYAKANKQISVTPEMTQRWGQSGSGSPDSTFTLSSVQVTTSWQRYSATFNLDSSANKTIGTGDHTVVVFRLPIDDVFDFDLALVQLEDGLTATPFRRNSPSIEAELAACQRYAEVFGAGSIGRASSSSQIVLSINPKVQKRANFSTGIQAAASVLKMPAGTFETTTLTIASGIGTATGGWITVNCSPALTGVSSGDWIFLHSDSLIATSEL